MSRRVLLALMGVVLWLGGVELTPNLHIALHASLAEHTHDGDSVIFEHAHAHRAQTLAERRHELALRLEHGAHSLAHHHIAMQPAAPPLLAPLPVDRRPVFLQELAIIELHSRVVPRAKARDPPLAIQIV